MYTGVKDKGCGVKDKGIGVTEGFGYSDTPKLKIVH